MLKKKNPNPDLVNIPIEEEDKLDEVNMYSEVTVLITKDSSEDPEINHSTSLAIGNQVLQINQEDDTNEIKENQITRIPYRHLNHDSKQLNKAMYLEQKQKIDVPKNTEVRITQSSHNSSSQVASHRKIPQKINLGWSDPFSVRQCCLSLTGSYQLVSTRISTPKREDIRSRKRDQAFLSTSYEDKAF